MKKCLLVAGGAVSASLLRKICREDEFAYIFAVDRGLEVLDACGIRPTHLVGDFDSVAPGILKKYLPSGSEESEKYLPAVSEKSEKYPPDMAVSETQEKCVPDMSAAEAAEKALPGYPVLERLIPEKDDTDTEHAMRQAAALKPDEIILLGGFGTRFDHVLANIHSLTIPLGAGIPACMLDETNRVRLLGGKGIRIADGNSADAVGKAVDPGTGGMPRGEEERTKEIAELRIKKRDAWGSYVSLLPLTTEVTGITLEGFKYSLSNAEFKIGETVSLGVSNELVAEEGIIRIKMGILAVTESADGG